MSKDVEKWSVATLKVFVMALMTEADRRYMERFRAHEDAVNAALAAHQRAVEKAEAATEKRFDTINEFKQALSDAYAAMMPRTESLQGFASVNEKMDIMGQRVASNMLKTEVEARMGSLVQKIDDLQQRMERNEGRAQGMSRGWALLLGTIGLIATLTSLYVAFSGHLVK